MNRLSGKENRVCIPVVKIPYLCNTRATPKTHIPTHKQIRLLGACRKNNHAM